MFFGLQIFNNYTFNFLFNFFYSQMKYFTYLLMLLMMTDSRQQRVVQTSRFLGECLQFCRSVLFLTALSTRSYLHIKRFMRTKSAKQKHFVQVDVVPDSALTFNEYYTKYNFFAICTLMIKATRSTKTELIRLDRCKALSSSSWTVESTLATG